MGVPPMRRNYGQGARATLGEQLASKDAGAPGGGLRLILILILVISLNEGG